MQHIFSFLVGKGNIVEPHMPIDRREHCGPSRIFVFRALSQDLPRTLKPRQRFRNLRADIHHLDHRRDHKREQRSVHDEIADIHLVRQHLSSAQKHNHRSHDSHENGRSQGHQRNCRQRLENVVEQAFCPGGEYASLTLFCVISLDDANAPQCFGQAPRYFSVDLAALAKNRPHRFKGALQDRAERNQNHQHESRHTRARAESRTVG